jgi:hypothetical protein
MERGWSIPVAQALQRHSGGWKDLPPVKASINGDGDLPQTQSPPVVVESPMAASLSLASDR